MIKIEFKDGAEYFCELTKREREADLCIDLMADVLNNTSRKFKIRNKLGKEKIIESIDAKSCTLHKLSLRKEVEVNE